MGRGLNRFISEVVLRPPIRVVGFIVRGLYWVLVGWWYEKRVRARQQEQLSQEIQEEFWFLFAERNARIVPNRDTGHLALLDCPIITVAADGLLFRFVHWRDERQVHITSEMAPNEWHELSAVLNVIEPDKVARHSIAFFQDAARLLISHLDLIKKGFSADLYPEIKRQFEDDHRREMADTRQMQDQVNRQLYGPGR